MNRVLICGLGSIGQRHIRILRRLGIDRIDAYSTGKHTLALAAETRPDRIFDDLTIALGQKPEAVFVCNPTSLHVPIAMEAVESGAHVLIEKPISAELDGCDVLVEQADKRGVVLAVGCNLRFHSLLGRVREIVKRREFGLPMAAHARFGSYLPDWHPWEDFHTSYAARRELGGGAALTHIHEIDYLLWLFGEQEKVRGAYSRVKPLGTDVDETTVGWIAHKGGTVSSVYLSLCEKPAKRSLEIVFERGHILLDFIENTLEVVAQERMRRVERPEHFSLDDTYTAQALEFSAACEGVTVPTLCSGNEAVNALKAALQLRGGWNE